MDISIHIILAMRIIHILDFINTLLWKKEMEYLVFIVNKMIEMESNGLLQKMLNKMAIKESEIVFGKFGDKKMGF